MSGENKGLEFPGLEESGCGRAASLHFELLLPCWEWKRVIQSELVGLKGLSERHLRSHDTGRLPVSRAHLNCRRLCMTPPPPPRSLSACCFVSRLSAREHQSGLQLGTKRE